MSAPTIEQLGFDPVLAPAANYLDLTPNERELLGERTRLVRHQFGQDKIGDQDIVTQRVHSGATLVNGFDYLPVGRGGLRLDGDLNYLKTNDQLAFDMTLKLAARGHTAPDMEHGGIYFTGAKGFMVGDARKLGVGGVRTAITRYAQHMHDNGLARHNRDGIAGDMNTNGYVDYYVAEVDRLNNHTYPYWKATSSGKKPQNGGVEFRTAATGYGTFAAHKAFLHETNRLTEGANDVRTVAVQGGGNVAGWYAHFASNDPNLAITHWSDIDGTISTPDKRGFNITREMVESIGDSPSTLGQRMELYAQALRTRHKELYGDDLELHYNADPNAIISAPVDDFMPAARGGTINKYNYHQLQVKGVIIEGGNDPLDETALAFCATNGIPVVRGHIANSGGSDVSVAEIKFNILEADFPERAVNKDWETLENGLMVSTRKLIHNVVAVQLESGMDFDTAANTVAVKNLVRYDQA